MIQRLTVACLFFTLCACGSEGSGSGSSATAAASAAAKPATSSAATPTETAAAGGKMVSCDARKMGLCSEWRGLDADETKEAKESCNDPGSVFGSAACPEDKLIGKCDHKDEKITLFIYPSEAAKDAKGAKEMCDDGVFTEAAKK